MNGEKNLLCLLEMAEQDDIFQVWKKDREIYEKKCKRYLKWCPRKMRDAFLGYAACNTMMQQRLLNIVCKNMKFKDKA